MPSSPSGWLRWSVAVLEAQGRPFSPRMEHVPRGDFRTKDSRESALSVKMILEKVCNGNGAGRLLVMHYVDEASWWSFSEHEQYILRQTIRRFRAELTRGGFLDPEGGEGEDGRSPVPGHLNAVVSV